MLLTSLFGFFFFPLSLSRKDPEYKLKSANQTPTALSNALTNSHEISRSIMDDRKNYIKGVSENDKFECESHKAIFLEVSKRF
jgi:hypothetical protein